MAATGRGIMAQDEGILMQSWSLREITNQGLMVNSTSMTSRSPPWTTPGLLTLIKVITVFCCPIISLDKKSHS